MIYYDLWMVSHSPGDWQGKVSGSQLVLHMFAVVWWLWRVPSETFFTEMV